MNFSNHYLQLSNEMLTSVTLTQTEMAAYYLASKGYTTMGELNDLGNMLLMGWEINR